MRRFFYNQPNLLQVGSTVPLTEDIFHHWCKVLRASMGEQALFFDGQGGEYTVTLKDVTKKQALVTINDFNPINRALPFTVNIALVMSRGERMDYAIQKATELGVSSIQLLTSQHGEVRLKADQADKKLAHWQQIAVSACEQCGLNIVPNLLAPKAVSDWIDEPAGVPTSTNVTKLILAVPPDDSGVVTSCNQIEGSDIEHSDIEHNDIEPIAPYTPYPNPLPHITNQFRQCSLAQFWLLIGAEGGFSAQEITQAIERGFMPWQIGERVLRTETAPVVALSSLLTLHQTLTVAQE
ncbi:16S rRNA (uracil(1498)-N(3))-methyltransferase [Moraxella osloensis]|uniref:Ribosomal RNA small subunit methyltransferase E n=1 Tax=Faucicola osloensis TaxID=34062 RepID=A0AAW6T7N8_FAUOS|nr:16S rRNA (uracil(1498)-N(3))-methyltransferase [Moraxella osloensis]MDI4508653.1 16S rRNA (uracil(1498)-N(3))-methyltransferase [Moraxella osloensis]